MTGRCFVAALERKRPLLELGVDGMITEMRLVTLSVIMMIRLNLNGECCYRSAAQSTK
jgi:hypothetical protein